MPFNSLATVNPGDVLSSSAWGNVAKANEDYLFSGRPGSAIVRINGSDYTTTSTTFVNVDGTNLSVTLTINSGKVLIAVGVNLTAIGGGAGIYWDVTIDGTRYGNTTQGINNNSTGFTVVKTGLSVGSHTFTLQWRSQSGASCSLGSQNSNYPVAFSVTEIG